MRVIELSAQKLLSAFEGGDIELMKEDGKILLLLDLKPILTMLETPVPKVTKWKDNSIVITSGTETVAVIQAESDLDAEEIRASLVDLLAMSS